MADPSDILVQFSHAVAARTAAAKGEVAALQVSGGRHLTGTVWRSDLLVASEQSLPKRDRFDVLLPGGGATHAELVGRDAGTNLALLRLAEPHTAEPSVMTSAQAGSLALAFGADGHGGVTARMGLVNAVGPEWHSRVGGRIDARILLDMRLSAAEEGGLVVDAEGRRLGITAFAPRRRVLVIPGATIESVLPLLLQHGKVARGWLGAAFQPVALPDALQSVAGQESGLMVLSLAAAGPAGKAGVMAGDIVLAIDGVAATGVRKVVPRLGAESVGRAAEIRLLRGGALVTLQAVIEARPDA